MKKVFICLLSFTFINLLYGYTDKHSMPASKSVLCETDNIEILRQVVDPAKDEYDIDVVALWLRDKKHRQRDQAASNNASRLALLAYE